MIKDIHRYIDAAVLKPEMNREEAVEAIGHCIDYKTRTVCVRPCDIDLAVEMCRGTKTEVSCVLAFPHGTATASVKAFEARDYIARGVHEIDMVANFGFIRSGLYAELEAEIRAVTESAGPAGIPVKVIFETCYLDAGQITLSVEAAIRAGAEYVKTSTGFGSGGATVETVGLMLEAARGRIAVKASGGIRDRQTAERFLQMGVMRLGSGYTSNAAIIDGDGSTSESY